MTVRLALTGSIGMGKSTTSQMFRDLGVPVWDADAVVHDLYQPGGAAIRPIGGLCPGAIVDGAVDRARLKDAIRDDPRLLDAIEGVVHPLVVEDRYRFLQEEAEADLVVLDIPLLFETGGDQHVDVIAVVTTDAETQRQRVLARPEMTEDTFQQILARQLPDAEKRQRADIVIETNTLDQTRRDVANLVEKIVETHKGGMNA